MAYIPLFKICPSIAEKETRVITLPGKNNEFNLPIGNYAFIELFCDECDCRRVFLHVLLNHKSVATIAYGWEKLSFYKNEFKGFSEKEIKEIKGPALELFQYQSEIADGVLEMFNKILLPDTEYIARIKRHYNQFKLTLRAINNK
ncbi:hypothetical protein [Roseimarinus sediminis]|uniref:hypothetical protein n=1 Tax=Roseimarinus sediminis TaxID=1610899 RepID=UPI003D241214